MQGSTKGKERRENLRGTEAGENRQKGNIEVI